MLFMIVGRNTGREAKATFMLKKIKAWSQAIGLLRVLNVGDVRNFVKMPVSDMVGLSALVVSP